MSELAFRGHRRPGKSHTTEYLKLLAAHEALKTREAALREALQKIVNMHTEDECGVCGSLRVATNALNQTPPKRD